ncbi:MAG: protein phosphatase 2C domain-containing protein [Acidobacteriota bacterium]
MRAPRVDLASASDIGRVRQRNEDHFAVADLTKNLRVLQSNLADAAPSDERCGYVFLVADGMGGVAGGARASELAIRSLLDDLVDDVPWFLDDRPATAGSRKATEQHHEADVELQRALAVSHRRVLEAARRELQHRGMGTTLTMALVVWPELYVAHVGDSRCYLQRGRRLHQLTRDDTMAQRLVEGGSMSKDQARSSRLSHMLTQVLGGAGDAIEPQIVRRTLEPGDRLLLTTDGLHGELSDRELELLAVDAPDAETLCRKAIDAANAAGGRDNSTLITAFFADTL